MPRTTAPEMPSVIAVDCHKGKVRIVMDQDRHVFLMEGADAMELAAAIAEHARHTLDAEGAVH